ncbi:hypothetical protein DNTS_016540 [Danionella cerebrum]|uniref:Uncharacterized protein n=1 Tax=Danionella cerebrum TaxID=2873325 RepID=A0A553RC29_9TELE|nr:hypothetical protein DNTS_016540 [Danionella translucida]
MFQRIQQLEKKIGKKLLERDAENQIMRTPGLDLECSEPEWEASVTPKKWVHSNQDSNPRGVKREQTEGTKRGEMDPKVKSSRVKKRLKMILDSKDEGNNLLQFCRTPTGGNRSTQR